MMRVRLSGLSVVLLVLVVEAACAKKATSPPPAPPPAAAVEPTPPPPVAPPAPAPQPSAEPSEDEIFARTSLADLNAQRPLAVVFFDLDDTAIRDDARSVLQRNAEWLRRWPTTRVSIEGHCDERGSAEYNLALGDRRAAAVKGYLVSLGIDANRLSTVSTGREQPICTTSDESCWQQNRRGAPVITAK